MPFRLSVLLIVCLVVSSSLASAAPAGEREECVSNLEEIYQSIQAFRQDNKKLPDWLSDLVPDYLVNPNRLVCPVSRRTGEIKNNGISDPSISTSYIYEFSVHGVPGISRKAKFTMRDWRQLQMARVGSVVPLLRCLHHDPVLHVTFEGKVLDNQPDWESQLAKLVDPGQLSARKMYFASRKIERPPVRVHTIDLATHYNARLTDYLHTDGKTRGPSLAQFPKGKNTFNGVEFEVNGVVQLMGESLSKITPGRYPSNVNDIQINRRVKNLHVLNGTGWKVNPPSRVAQLVVHYEDGDTVTIPIRYERQVYDWWQQPSTDPEAPLIAWEGPIGKAGSEEKTGCIYQFSWRNPQPGQKISSIDFVSMMRAATPFLLGISVETP